MNFNISAWAIRKPVPSLVLFVVLTLLGISAFQSLPVARAPNIDLPLVTVSIAQAGAAPEELESDVTRLVENAVAGIAGIRHVSSLVTDGVSITRAEFQMQVPSDSALFEVKSRVDALRNRLPADIDAPVVAKLDVEGQVLVTWQVSAPARSLAELSWFIDDTVATHLRGVPGVGDVVRVGGNTREIEVALRPDRLLALGATVADVQQALRGSRVDLPAGHWNAGAGQQPVRVLARARSAAELADTPLPLAGRTLRLGDIARVTDVNAEAETFLRRNGEQSVVAFSVFRARGANEVAVAQAVTDALPALQAAAPDIRFTRIDETVSATQETFHAAMSTLIEGAMLAIIVVLLFLRDWRATLIAAASLPLSIIPTFWVLELAGYSLNMLTLLAVTLVTGILVDDAIVEIENIERHMHMGKPPRQATFDATAEIGLAVMAISVSVAVVFAPVGMMSGVAGQYFKQFGLTVAVSVLFSLLVARLITPILAARFLRPPKAHAKASTTAHTAAHTAASTAEYTPDYTAEHTADHTAASTHAQAAPVAQDGRYARVLAWVVRRRWTVLGISVLGFVMSLLAASQLPDDLIPLEDTGRLVFAVEAPPGGTAEQLMEQTDVLAQQLRAAFPEVRQVMVEGGVSPSGKQELRLASVTVQLQARAERKRSQRELQLAMRDFLRTLPDLRAWPLNDNGGREVEVSVTAADPQQMQAAVASVEARMRALGLVNIAAQSGAPRKEIHITPRLDDAARLGISTAQIAEAVRLAAVGDVDTALPMLKAEDRLVPIRVRLDVSARHDIDMLRALPVARVDNRTIPLSAVANVQWQGGPSSIERYDRQRRVLVGADLAGGQTLGTALASVLDIAEPGAVSEAASGKERSAASGMVPAGVSVKASGDGEVMEEVLQGFISALALGLLLMFAVLVLLFSSLRQPLVIMLSLPLAVTGAILALFITNTPVNMPVFIGLLMLMGIVAKNAIMLVDFAKLGEEGGLTPADAIVQACRTRARPILMTTLAMAAGMLPSALGLGGGGGFRAPMAIVVIGGLLVATLLSLLTTPALYLLVDSLRPGARRAPARSRSGAIPGGQMPIATEPH